METAKVQKEFSARGSYLTKARAAEEYKKIFELRPAFIGEMQKLRDQTKGIRDEAIFGSDARMSKHISNMRTLLKAKSEGMTLDKRQSNFVRTQLSFYKGIASGDVDRQADVLAPALRAEYTKMLRGNAKAATNPDVKDIIRTELQQIRTMTNRQVVERTMSSDIINVPASITDRYDRARRWLDSNGYDSNQMSDHDVLVMIQSKTRGR